MIRIKEMMKKKNGFSLIELLVVISIIGVLSAVLMVNFVGTRERARDSQKIQDLNSLKSALRLYYNDNQSYPVQATYVSCSNSSFVSEIEDYFPTISSLNCIYISDGDYFVVNIQLESTAGTAISESQEKCGVEDDDLGDDVYVVCAN